MSKHDGAPAPPTPTSKRKRKERTGRAPRKPKWVRPPLPPSPERSPSPPPLPRRRAQRSRKRAAKKALAHKGIVPGVTPEQRSHFARIASTVPTGFDTDDIRFATSGYIGVERVEEEVKEQRQLHTLEELVGDNSPWKFNVIPADMNNPAPTLLTDASHRVFATRIPPPAGDPTFPDQAAQAAATLDEYRPLFFNENEAFAEHRRGNFPVKAFGVSYGGGQEVPKMIYQSDLDLELVNRIRRMRCFNRLAGQASAAFEMWAPKLHALYMDYTDRLGKLLPNMTRNFPSSVFSCCTINFGPRTTTVEHLDHKNYIYGWCAITALGSFDHRLGGHLVLWDLKQVIEFPPGWTMLIPSAYLRHSNTSLRPGDTRFSLTQYTAGGLFRVVDDEGTSRKKMKPDERRSAEQQQRDRITEDLNCYSTLEELGIDTPV
ncbi:hypothetical protein FB446DRAFT_649854 [Lentinula raphanica]|nr:hypothetical protein FB446DRAFT_649854 [Lentinula raphanica]